MADENYVSARGLHVKQLLLCFVPLFLIADSQKSCFVNSVLKEGGKSKSNEITHI